MHPHRTDWTNWAVVTTKRPPLQRPQMPNTDETLVGEGVDASTTTWQYAFPPEGGL